MTEMINKIGERLVIKARCVNCVLNEWYSGRMDAPLRTNPHYSEFRGMLDMVKTMGLNHEVTFNADTTRMVAITIDGKRFEI